MNAFTDLRVQKLEQEVIKLRKAIIKLLEKDIACCCRGRHSDYCYWHGVTGMREELIL